MAGDVGTRTSDTAALGDGGLKAFESGDHHVGARGAAHAFAVVNPAGRGLMAAFVVAALAGGQFVFYPAGAALDAGHEVLGGGRIQGVVERGRTPHAIGAIAFDDLGHALTAVHLAFAAVAVLKGFLPCHRAIVAVPRSLASFVGCKGSHGGREKGIRAMA